MTHPYRPVRRLYFWAGRNKFLATTLAASFALVLGLVLLLFSVQQAKTRAAETKAEAARESEQLQRRESDMIQAQSILAMARRTGWSNRAFDLYRKAAAIRRDDALRNQVAATLAGVDARIAKSFKSFGATSLLFDPQGKRLLMSTTAGTKIWDSSTDRTTDLDSFGDGPLGFRPGRDAAATRRRRNPSNRNCSSSIWRAKSTISTFHSPKARLFRPMR